MVRVNMPCSYRSPDPSPTSSSFASPAPDSTLPAGRLCVGNILHRLRGYVKIWLWRSRGSKIVLRVDYFVPRILRRRQDSYLFFFSRACSRHPLRTYLTTE